MRQSDRGRRRGAEEADSEGEGAKLNNRKRIIKDIKGSCSDSNCSVLPVVLAQEASS